MLGIEGVQLGQQAHGGERTASRRCARAAAPGTPARCRRRRPPAGRGDHVAVGRSGRGRHGTAGRRPSRWRRRTASGSGSVKRLGDLARDHWAVLRVIAGQWHRDC
jgi:hypothetical protein